MATMQTGREKTDAIMKACLEKAKATPEKTKVGL
jgi:hypothetical protein